MTELKLSQQLVMTPQLQMAIRLLALPLGKLREELPELVAKTPPLETRDRGAAPAEEWNPLPEVFVSRDLVVTANDAYPSFVVYGTEVPLVLDPSIEQTEFAMTDHTPEEIAFARGAIWLVRAIQQRARSYVKLARVLVEKSPKEVFTHAACVPSAMKLRDLAEAVGMHESTITRMVSSGQTMRTDRGDLTFKAFVKSR